MLSIETWRDGQGELLLPGEWSGVCWCCVAVAVEWMGALFFLTHNVRNTQEEVYCYSALIRKFVCSSELKMVCVQQKQPHCQTALEERQETDQQS